MATQMVTIVLTIRLGHWEMNRFATKAKSFQLAPGVDLADYLEQITPQFVSKALESLEWGGGKEIIGISHLLSTVE